MRIYGGLSESVTIGRPPMIVEGKFLQILGVLQDANVVQDARCTAPTYQHPCVNGGCLSRGVCNFDVIFMTLLLLSFCYDKIPASAPPTQPSGKRDPYDTE